MNSCQGRRVPCSMEDKTSLLYAGGQAGHPCPAPSRLPLSTGPLPGSGILQFNDLLKSVGQQVQAVELWRHLRG